MSLHHHNSSGGNGFGGLFVILPWWLGLPLIGILLLFALAQSADIDAHKQEWQAVAEKQGATWVAAGYGEDAKVLSCRWEEGSIFHCNAKVPSGVVAFDCDGAKPGVCELCDE